MGFFNEGKKLSYDEVIKTVEALVKQDVLSHLEVQELNNLLEKILSFTEENLSQVLVMKGYNAKEIKDAFAMAEQINLLNHSEIWEKAVKMKEDKRNNKATDKEELVEFIEHDYLNAMKALNRRLRQNNR